MHYEGFSFNGNFMSINVNDLITYTRDFLESEDPNGYWTDPMLVRFLNMALDWSYMKLSKANEFFGLTKTTVTVTAGTTSVDLPDGCIYVSDYKDAELSIDFRPYVSEDARFVLERDYYIANDQFNFHTTDTVNRVVTLWVKNLPARITSPTGTISLGRYWFNLLSELMIFYAKRRDENVSPETDHVINSMFKEVRRTINTMSGSVRTFQIRYDLPD